MTPGRVVREWDEPYERELTPPQQVPEQAPVAPAVPELVPV